MRSSIVRPIFRYRTGHHGDSVRWTQLRAQSRPVCSSLRELGLTGGSARFVLACQSMLVEFECPDGVPVFLNSNYVESVSSDGIGTAADGSLFTLGPDFSTVVMQTTVDETHQVKGSVREVARRLGHKDGADASPAMVPKLCDCGLPFAHLGEHNPR